jgi:hypothetical protein
MDIIKTNISLLTLVINSTYLPNIQKRSFFLSLQQLWVESVSTRAAAIWKCDFENKLLELFVRDRVIVSVSLKTL